MTDTVAASNIPARSVARSIALAFLLVTTTPALAREAFQKPFPAFGQAQLPVRETPDWGAMHSPEKWGRTYDEIPRSEFVPIPAYDRRVLTTPLSQLQLLGDRAQEELTAKLFYSTRHMGSYDLDADEESGDHPGFDFKLPIGTPVGAIGGGRVHAVRQSERLGLHVIIEHRTADGTFFSVYGHLQDTSVQTGEDVTPGQSIGTVGMTGSTSAAHLHFQIDRPSRSRRHIVYVPPRRVTPTEAGRHTVHPLAFIETNGMPDSAMRIVRRQESPFGKAF